MKLINLLPFLALFSASAARVKLAGRNTSSVSIHRASVAIDSFGGHELELSKPKLKTKMKSKGRARGPTNAAGERERENYNSSVHRIGECDESFPAPDRAVIMCPQQCPLMRFHPEKLCHWRCISEDKCRAYPGVIDRKAGYCFVCAVPGCAKCKTDVQECAECIDGFDLHDGECHAHSSNAWTGLLTTMGVLAVLAVAYVVYLAWRPVVSQGALDWGLEFRSKVKHRKDDSSHALYDLNMSLADTVTSAGGIGANLHFSWQRITLCWSAVVTLGAMFVTWYHERLFVSDALEMAPTHDEVEGVCTERLMKLTAAEKEDMRIDFLIFTGIVYVVTTVGCIAFAWWQRQKFENHEASASEMTNYALECSGFPIESDPSLTGEGTLTLEKEYLRFFRGAWGDSVIGVSISWNLAHVDDQVKGVVSNIVLALETEHKSENPNPEDAQEINNVPETPPSNRAACCCQPFLDGLNGIWWGELPAFLDHLGSETKIPSERKEIMQLLKDLPTTGFCFVVFKTERASHEALHKQLPNFRGEHEINVRKTQGDAETVLWDGYSISNAQRTYNCAKGVLAVLLLILIWTICFWGPYTAYILSWQRTGGASQGVAIHGTVIGLLITVGNQIVYAACGLIAEKCGYRCRDERDSYGTALYTAAVAINTVLDMWLVTVMGVGWQRDAASDPDALVRNPSLQHAIFSQLIFYLWPCTLLLPFLLEPVVLNVAPYFLAKWLVRARPNCSKLEAEECLLPPPFDLNRYGDNLINIMMVCLFFLLTAVTLWWIFFMLTISLLVIYTWDCYRFKRGTLRTHFATADIEIMAQYVMAVPCALLASGFAFKLMGGQSMVASWGPDDFLEQPEVWTKVTVAFCVHMVVHWLLLALMVPACVVEMGRSEAAEGFEARDVIPYEHTASLICCNWFNANPVHCIRSHYLYEHQPAHIFYQPGREYLHKKNERPEDQDALIIYESDTFDPEVDMFEDLKAGASIGLNAATTNLMSASASLKITITSPRTPRSDMSG